MASLNRDRRTVARALRAALALVAASMLPAGFAAASGPDRPRPAPGGTSATAPATDPDLRRTAAGPAFVPGEVIVGFEPGAGRDERSAARRATRTAVESALPVPRAQLLRIRDGGPPGRVARTLERRPGVAYAEPNYYVQASLTPNEPDQTELWGLDNAGQLVRRQAGIAGADISAFAAWDLTTGDPGVTVAVVDTGVDAAHPDLAANMVAGGWDFVDEDADPGDENGHGTHVAGTIGAVGDNGAGTAGVAWEVGLMAVRVLDENGDGTVADVAAGFEHAAQSGAEVVNASLGWGGSSQTVDAVIAAAPQTAFVVAAGNDGADNDVTPTYPCNIPRPNVVCVAATDQRDALAGFSNRGSDSVDLAAPGVDTYSTAAAGVGREYSFEGFEEPLAGRWSPDDNDTWDRVGAPAFSGAWSLADSPGGPYSPNSHTWVDSPVLSLAGGSDCGVTFRALADVHPSDAFVLDVSTDGFATYETYSLPATSAWTPISASLSELDGEPEVQLSFRLWADGDANVGAGAHVDDVSVHCAGAGPGYDFKSGTSMATPHVAGAAALILAEHPGTAVGKLTQAIRDGVDPKPSLAGTTATGGRLNARRSLALAADTTAPKVRWVTRPPRRSRQRVNRFRFRSNEAQVSFRCRFNRGPWRTCTPPRRYRRLQSGRHVFRVRAEDESGNTSKRRIWRFRVVR